MQINFAKKRVNGSRFISQTVSSGFGSWRSLLQFVVDVPRAACMLPEDCEPRRQFDVALPTPSFHWATGHRLQPTW